MFLARMTAAIQSFHTNSMLYTCLAISTMRIVIKGTKTFLMAFPSLPAEEPQTFPSSRFSKLVGRGIKQTVDQTKDVQNPVDTHHGNGKSQNFVDWMKSDCPSPCAMTGGEEAPMQNHQNECGGITKDIIISIP
jgi:hypothetical protein